MSDFPCTGCGACCRRINLAVQFHGITDPTHPLYFPYGWDKNGACQHLTKDNKCAIYDKRPLFCNIEKYTEYLGENKDSFYQFNIEACNSLMDEDDLPLHYRIKIK